jgi:alpha-tubulin suppressor-like RCC1 family protein
MAQEQVTPTVATGKIHTVGLKSDGTVVATGSNTSEQCAVGGWTLS